MEKVVSINVLGPVAISTLLMLLLTKLYLLYAYRFVSGSKRTKLAYRSFLVRAADLGLTRNTGETRQEYSKRLESKKIDAAEITKINEENIYTDKTHNPDQALAKATAMQAWWKRALSFFNPLSVTKIKTL